MEGHQGAIVADVVHQDLDPPMFGEHSLGQPGYVIVDGDVDDVAADASACTGHLVADPIRALLIDLGDFNECSVLGEQAADPGADAVASAGDHRNPSIE